MQKATLQRARVHNSRLVLKIIYTKGPISRAEVARITNLTPPTISDVVAELIDKGLVKEVGYAPSSSGRRAILLQVVDDSHELIGVDLSRQDFRGALVNLRVKIKHQENLPLGHLDGDAALTLVYDLIDTLIEKAARPLLGIGIGTPGLVDSHNGILQQSVNLNWRYIPLRSLLQSRYNLPVYMANDCQVAALAVHTFTNIENDDLPLVVINAGWGVGAGIILNNQLLHGSPAGAGEIGHVSVVDNGDLCACGNRGCLETVASSRAIIKRVKDIIEKDPHSSLNGIITDPDQITLEAILQAFEAGNEDVRRIVHDAGKALGIAAANLVGILGRCRILVRGDVSKFGQFLIDVMWEELERRSLPSLVKNSHLGILDVSSDIVIQGASALVLRNELGVL